MNKFLTFLFCTSILFLFFGCTTLPSTTNFKLNKAFSVLPQETYFNQDENISIIVVSFSDSRCPVGVVCVWEGEEGVNLIIKFNSNLDQWSTDIYLGEKTKNTFSFSPSSVITYEVSLTSINVDKNEAQLIVKKLTPNVNEKAWFSIAPIQCKGNKWDLYFNEKYCGGSSNCTLPKSEENKIKEWLSDKYSISIYDYASKQTQEIVCLACSCPRGDTIAILVDLTNSPKMTPLGFSLMEPIFCTADAKLCPDGRGVGRVAPFCDFAPCPSN